MNDELYDVRVGMETYSRIISESITEQETWRDMVSGAVELCSDIRNELVCTENPYLRELLVDAVAYVLIESKDIFSDSDHVRELALVKSTKSVLEQMVSDMQDDVDDCYPECAECAGECTC